MLYAAIELREPLVLILKGLVPSADANGIVEHLGLEAGRWGVQGSFATDEKLRYSMVGLR